jgi:hypothetical protein
VKIAYIAGALSFFSVLAAVTVMEPHSRRIHADLVRIRLTPGFRVAQCSVDDGGNVLFSGSIQDQDRLWIGKYNWTDGLLWQTELTGIPIPPNPAPNDMPRIFRPVSAQNGNVFVLTCSPRTGQDPSKPTYYAKTISPDGKQIRTTWSRGFNQGSINLGVCCKPYNGGTAVLILYYSDPSSLPPNQNNTTPGHHLWFGVFDADGKLLKESNVLLGNGFYSFADLEKSEHRTYLIAAGPSQTQVIQLSADDDAQHQLTLDGHYNAFPGPAAHGIELIGGPMGATTYSLVSIDDHFQKVVEANGINAGPNDFFLLTNTATDRSIVGISNHRQGFSDNYVGEAALISRSSFSAHWERPTSGGRECSPDFADAFAGPGGQTIFAISQAFVAASEQSSWALDGLFLHRLSPNE